MRIVKDGWPLIVGIPVAGIAVAVLCRWMGCPATAVTFLILGLVGGAFMLYFFRDPDRNVPADPNVLVAGADGLIRAVETVQEARLMNCECVRISIFLSPFDVHVNRSPIAGKVTQLGYTPGKHLLTIQNAASEYNEHSTILIEGERTRCLVKQIVGPVVRRVVYWLEMNQVLGKGAVIGMMKFGSRLDMYFPKADVDVTITKGSVVKAGETVVAVLAKGKTL